MERARDSNLQNTSKQTQEQRIQSTAIVKVQEPSIKIEPTVGGQFLRKLFQIIFYIQFFLLSVLIIALTIRSLIYAAGDTDRFYPKHWYPPLLVSIASAWIVSFVWQSIAFHHPSNAIKSAFWLTPLLTCALGVLHILIGSPLSLAAGTIAIVSSVIQSLYACWVNSRFDYASKILAVSTSVPPDKTTAFVVVSIVTCLAYSSFSVAGIGGATATGTGLDIVFIVLILFSFIWTMQVVKNMLYVTISRVRYMTFACGVDTDTRSAFRDTVKHLVGSVCIGSAFVPVIGTIRGSARAVNLIAGGNDEFLFSCADCYSGFASTLITYGNRWGFVHVGVYNKGFIQASADTWEMFKRAELITLIDSDLTGVFCFLSGVTVGSICGIIGGTWELIIHKSYATEVSIYAFLIGYFMCRIALAWQQASVSAYYVAYAENPQSARFDATIPVRLERLHRFQV
ncbi:DnaJ/Hsp40 cysteine-rich domain superfamily protein isoform 1 [Hibiscus syriacus]|uniref:Choline transporter-like protein n=1 Tax=Hibiscus syriacus TaxID=106335 RepID=A0A6A3BZM1_HIBSY|nr:protein PNS1-like [Hibiscus syriacus]KAE8720452.1 DnaJ/Hsp40 cysteine-rich domain superfamily protein isoform 1 [Hibiscus syriacus]